MSLPEHERAPFPALPQGPLSCLKGELAEHADLQLTDVICESLLAPQVPSPRMEQCLRLLRVTYWMGFYDRSGMWYGQHERDQFDAAVSLLRCETGETLSDTALLYARLVAEADASDACGVAHN